MELKFHMEFCIKVVYENFLELKFVYLALNSWKIDTMHFLDDNIVLSSNNSIHDEI